MKFPRARLSKGVRLLGIIALLALLAALETPPAWARDQIDDMAAQAWGELTGRAVDSYVNLIGERDKANAEIVRARQAFFARQPHGAGMDEAKKRFDDLLLGKDLLYLGQAVVYGFENRQYEEVFLRRGTVGPFLVTGDIDNGIPGAARAAFLRLVGALRADIRADLKARGQKVGRDEDPLFVLPDMFVAALRKNQDAFRAYQQVREYDEFHRAGVAMPGSDDPKTYILRMLQIAGELSPDEALADYEALRQAVGEKKLLESARQVAAVPLAEDDQLRDIAQLGLVRYKELPEGEIKLPSGKSADGKTVIMWASPKSVLKALWSRDNPRAYAVQLIANANRLNYATAWRAYQAIEKAVGKKKLEAAAAAAYAAPKRGAGDVAALGLLVTPVRPRNEPWEKYRPFDKLEADLLAGDDTRAQVRYLIAIETMDPEVVDTTYEKLVKVKEEDALFAAAAELRAAHWKAKGGIEKALRKMLDGQGGEQQASKSSSDLRPPPRHRGGPRKQRHEGIGGGE